MLKNKRKRYVSGLAAHIHIFKASPSATADMRPLIDNILQEFECTPTELKRKMFAWNKALCTYLRKLPIYYNHTEVKFHGFTQRDAEREPFQTTSVKKVFEAKTDTPMNYPWLPCIVQITNNKQIDKYPLEFLFTPQ